MIAHTRLATNGVAQQLDFALRRRCVVAGFSLLAAAPRAWAQTAARTWRLGWISLVDSFSEPYGLAFVQRLRELGFAEGRNLVIERRSADGHMERLADLADDLARQNCDIYFAAGAEANLVALKQASRGTPIVIVANDYDPVAAGHVLDLAHPGGRITGVTQLQSILPAKRLELLKELVPKFRRVGVFGDAGTAGQLGAVKEAAKRIGVTLHVVEFRSVPYDYEAAFAELKRANVDALIVLASGLFVPARRRIPELALKARLPSAFGQAQWTEAGGLLSYGFDFSELYRRAADLAARIMRGARAGDIPMEQPSKFELTINKATARALGVAIPPSILVRADRLIE